MGWRINELILAVENGSDLDRDRALLRLYTLFKKRLLSGDQRDHLAKAIWSKTGDDGWPHVQTQNRFIFLDLPETVPGRTKELFFSCYVDGIIAGNISEPVLHTLSGGLGTSFEVMEEAKKSFDKILCSCLEWYTGNSDGPILQSKEDRVKHATVDLLVSYILCEVDRNDIASETREIWYRTLTDDDDKFMVATAYNYLNFFPESADEVIRVIRKAIYCRSRRRIESGYFAIQKFINASKQKSQEMPRILVSDVVSTCENMRQLGLNYSLNAAVRLVEAALLSAGETQRLSEAVELLWSEYSYHAEVVGEDRKIDLTLVRSECVRLANALKVSGFKSGAVDTVCNEAVADPIPEVRYAVRT